MFECAVRASCNRLHVDCIDVYLLHNPVHWKHIEYWITAAAQCKEKRLIKTLGLSNCDPVCVKRAYTVSKEYGIDIVCHQIHFLYFATTVKSFKK